MNLPLYLHLYLPTSLPTYISTYLHLHMEYCATHSTRLDSQLHHLSTYIYLPTSTFETSKIHKSPVLALLKPFPVKGHTEPTGQERRNRREPLVFFQSGSLLLGSLRGPLRSDIFGQYRPTHPTGKGGLQNHIIL